MVAVLVIDGPLVALEVCGSPQTSTLVCFGFKDTALRLTVCQVAAWSDTLYKPPSSLLQFAHWLLPGPAALLGHRRWFNVNDAHPALAQMTRSRVHTLGFLVKCFVVQDLYDADEEAPKGALMAEICYNYADVED